LYVGTANKNYFLAHGLKLSQLIYAPHAIDINRFAADDDEQNTQALKWREELGITAEEIVFLFAGKLSKKKNPEILVEAVREAVELVSKYGQWPNLKALICRTQAPVAASRART